MFGNTPEFGGDLLDTVHNEFSNAKSAVIASGYVSHDIINEFEPDFIRLAEERDGFKLLIGMAFYEGLSQKMLTKIEGVHHQLSDVSNGKSGVYVAYNRRFHGKIYSFQNGDGNHVYLGSSNFSRSGLQGNLECTAQVLDHKTQHGIEQYLQYLFDQERAVPVVKADITVPGSKEYKKRLALTTLDDLQKYDPATINQLLFPHFELPLGRIVEHEKSNLNVYFGKGRWARSSGKVTPRPWYEAELIAVRAINSHPLYPHGDFLAYTDDGYIIPMRTQGDYHKNIRSKGSLSIFGQWIKGKLQKANALIPLTPVTQDTLDIYGSDTLRFYKLAEGKYYLEF